MDTLEQLQDYILVLENIIHEANKNIKVLQVENKLLSDYSKDLLKKRLELEKHYYLLCAIGK